MNVQILFGGKILGVIGSKGGDPFVAMLSQPGTFHLSHTEILKIFMFIKKKTKKQKRTPFEKGGGTGGFEAPKGPTKTKKGKKKKKFFGFWGKFQN